MSYEHTRRAKQSTELAWLLSQRVQLRDDEHAREEYRRQLELAQVSIEIALDELKQAEAFYPDA